MCIRDRARDARSNIEYQTSAGGNYLAATIKSGITGMGFDTGLIDDPIKGIENAYSATERDNVWNWYQTDFYSRRHPKSRIIGIGTRWHDDDMMGRLFHEAATKKKQING